MDADGWGWTLQPGMDADECGWMGMRVDGDEVLEGEMENQLRSFKETVLRLAKRRVEQVFRLLLGEVHPGSWVRFAEMDVTDLRADGEFFDVRVTWFSGNTPMGSVMARRFRGIGMNPAWLPTHVPRRSCRCAWPSTTGAGRAFRSICAPGSVYRGVLRRLS